MHNELFTRIVEMSIMAPSGHNTQPWKFHLDDNSITIFPDFDRQLPAVDPFNREIYISLGCALENLLIAAKHYGYATSVSILETHVVVGLTKTQNRGIAPLFGDIALRSTNRALYDNCKLPDSDIAQLREITPYIYGRESKEFELICEKVYEGNSVQMKSSRFRDELKKWMRYNKSDSEGKRDGLSYAVFGAPDLPRFISKTVMGMMINAKMQNRADRKKLESSSHIAVFIGGDSIKEWIEVGQELERFLLLANNLGVSCAYENQPCEVSEIADKLKDDLQTTSRPQIILRIGHSTLVARSLRRRLDSFLV